MMAVDRRHLRLGLASVRVIVVSLRLRVVCRTKAQKTVRAMLFEPEECVYEREGLVKLRSHLLGGQRW